MRKSSAFVTIPTVPTTVSGQWLTYSHMANHYRRLLNVKPRVQTNAPKRPSLAALQASTLKFPKKASSNATKGTGRSSAGVPSNTTLRTSSKSYQVPAKAKSYHIIFDQSELNNLSEAVMSDSEVEEPNVHQMGIDEKINLYLSHQSKNGVWSDDSQSARSSSPYLSNCGPRSREPRSTGRHSKCFIPHVDTANRERPNPKLSPTRAPKFKSTNGRSPAQMSPPKLLTQKSFSSKTSSIKLLQQSYGKPVSETNKIATKTKPHITGRKCGEAWDCGSSIGTVRGSDDMTDPRLLSLVSERNKSSLKRKANGGDVIGGKPRNGFRGTTSPPDWSPRGGNGIRLTSANNRQQKSSLLPGFVNKDSSRDSAYGFSSGESKITTRESTPEKMRTRKDKKVHVEANGHGRSKYKSNLSTVASSINQESLGDSLTYNPNPVHNPPKYAQVPQKSSSNWMTDEKYVNFVTTVTDDIIKREVFTNKGLKSLFMSHIDANRDLDMEKMLQMLDRLRMDVGVPKDDSLNQMEFGYGSIKYSTGSFFPPQSSHKFNSEGSGALPGENTVRGNKSAPSDVTIVELHRHLQNFISGDESSKMSSRSGSLLNENLEEPCQHRNLSKHIRDPYEDDFPCRDSTASSPPSSKSSGPSLTESEIQRALDEVGFDAKVSRDITRIVKEGSQRRRQKGQEIVEQNNNKPSKNSDSIPRSSVED